MKFCCEKFKSRVEVPDNLGLNIRIMKLEKDSIVDESVPIRVFITAGYLEGNFNDATRMPIRYCPFCGIDVLGYYDG